MTEFACGEEDIKKGRLLFSHGAHFVKSVVTYTDLPGSGLPEVAFVGRSNVGKSSLLNMLVGKKGLARTSNTPGRTKELNYFEVRGIAYLVDMPGYGYARASKKQRNMWNTLLLQYVKNRPTLRRLFLLIDSRRGIKSSDREFMAILDTYAVSYVIVFTKMDKLNKVEGEKITSAQQNFLVEHSATLPFFLHTSSKKKWGVDNLRAYIYTSIQ